MTVILREQYKDDNSIKTINQTLVKDYGATDYPKFNPWYHLKDEAKYMNTDPDGKEQLSEWKRPITAERLSRNFFWLRNGELNIKISGGPCLDDAKDAVAVGRWLEATECMYINIGKSDNYDRNTLIEYLDYVFEEDGGDIAEIWKEL